MLRRSSIEPAMHAVCAVASASMRTAHGGCAVEPHATLAEPSLPSLPSSLPQCASKQGARTDMLGVHARAGGCTVAPGPLAQHASTHTTVTTTTTQGALLMIVSMHPKQQHRWVETLGGPQGVADCCCSCRGFGGGGQRPIPRGLRRNALTSSLSSHGDRFGAARSGRVAWIGKPSRGRRQWPLLLLAALRRSRGCGLL